MSEGKYFNLGDNEGWEYSVVCQVGEDNEGLERTFGKWSKALRFLVEYTKESVNEGKKRVIELRSHFEKEGNFDLEDRVVTNGVSKEILVDNFGEGACDYATYLNKGDNLDNLFEEKIKDLEEVEYEEEEEEEEELKYFSRMIEIRDMWNHIEGEFMHVTKQIEKLEVSVSEKEDCSEEVEGVKEDLEYFVDKVKELIGDIS